ncbi:SGNH/GDSL hydrolase family protein [uncultured Croceitalea sp.]|uniref:SGNH/GDSL hydrolase family protein n=1 Tax=uncultured Croceitalea sp. TaxID=1798908 RepID=UPI0033060729
MKKNNIDSIVLYKKKQLILLVVISFWCTLPILASCLDNETTQIKTIKVLFIGNSLTYYNELPKLVKERAMLQNIHLKADVVAYPNYAIEDHWNDGDVQKLIANNNYHFVFIQQGPSSQAIGRTMLFEYGKKFKKTCHDNNSKLVYFMVWPSKTYYRTFDRVIANYKDAALANNAIICPVGAIWKANFDATGDLSYYGIDGFHPSLKGSKVAAQTIITTLIENLK